MSRDDLIDGLHKRVEEVRQAHATHDIQGEWLALSGALDVLYQLTEHDKRQSPQAHYARLAASTPGFIVAGLVWIRGRMVHAGVDAQRAELTPMESYIVQDGKLEPIQWFTVMAGQLVETRESTVVVVWPARKHIPTTGERPHQHDGATQYEQHVAGRSLIEPLEDAIRYFRP